MAEICPSQLVLCPACGCLLGQDNILLKSLYVQELNVWLSPSREYLLSCLCTSFQSVSSCACASPWWHNQPQQEEKPPLPGAPFWTCLICRTASAGVEVPECGFISPGTVCCCSAEVEPWGSAVPRQPMEGFGHRAHWPQAEPYPPLCLGGNDFADLLHCPEWLPAYLCLKSVLNHNKWREGMILHNLLQTSISRQISSSRGWLLNWKSLIKQHVGLSIPYGDQYCSGQKENSYLC